MDMERRSSHIELVDKITEIQVILAKGFAEAEARHQASAKEVGEIKKEQERITHLLFGNGKEGLITTVTIMNKKLNIMWVILCLLSAAFLSIAVGMNIFQILPHLIG